MKIKRFDKFLEDVGDKYAERKFHIPRKFTEFDKLYRRRYNNIVQEVIYRDSRTVLLKNPGTLENIGDSVRGIIDKKGNFYVEQEADKIHDQIIPLLSDLGLIKFNITTWHIVDPNDPDVGFITVQRRGYGNIFLGESNYWYRDHKEPDIAQNIFQEFLHKAKLKNPGITFVNSV